MGLGKAFLSLPLLFFQGSPCSAVCVSALLLEAFGFTCVLALPEPVCPLLPEHPAPVVAPAPGLSSAHKTRRRPCCGLRSIPQHRAGQLTG